VCQNQRTEMSRKGSRKETKIQELIYRDTTDVEYQMYDHTRNSRSSKERITEDV